jgi:group I intron endonuclease
MGTIYTLQNIYNKKIYVGKTINKFPNRYKSHLNPRLNFETYISNAIKKYGINSFCITLKYWPDKDLDNEEIRLIKALNCLAPNGYNLRDGGNSGLINEITKKKISDKVKEQWKDIEYATKMREKIKISYSKEVRDKISNSVKLIMSNAEYKNKIRLKIKKLWESKDKREKQSIIMKERYKDPILRLKISNLVKQSNNKGNNNV